MVGRHFYAVNKELSVDTPRQRGILIATSGVFGVSGVGGGIDHCVDHVLPLHDFLSQFLGLE